MNFKLLIPVLLLFNLVSSHAQDKGYMDSMSSFIKKYIETHEVVTDDDKQYLKFYPINEKYRVIAKFELVKNSPWFKMQTSGAISKIFRIYGSISFSINDTMVRLHIYQSQDLMESEKYKDHLFIPFMDLTTGEETYTTGRYMDFNINDIKDQELLIDFNKAYNPYCAYVSVGYNCPIPPRENHLNVAIVAGEKEFSKKKEN